MNTYWGSRGMAPRVLNLCAGWRRVVSFIPMKGAAGTHLIGGWLGPTASLDAMAKRKIPATARSLVTVLIELPRIICITCGRVLFQWTVLFCALLLKLISLIHQIIQTFENIFDFFM